VWVADPVDPSQILIMDSVGLAYAKEILLIFDDMSDASELFLEWKARSKSASVDDE
jgi:hypothetical protein